MKKQKNSVGKVIKRGVIGSVLKLSQDMDLTKFTEGNDIYYDDVEEKLNIPYINREEVPLAMDVFKPKVEEGTELPVLVTIHGGGLTIGDRKLSRPFARMVAHKGYLVFSVEYRLAPKANVCQELDDVCAGLNLVGEQLVNYDVDFTRMFIAAESAGAYLALYVTAMTKSKKLQEVIGYKPSRMNFKALGLMSPMIYTNQNDPCGWLLSDQIYGEKRVDEEFLELMNPEHPEIINNIPPTFVTSSNGDFINHYSTMFTDALKKLGKPYKYVYYADEELQHAFSTMQPTHPKSIDSIDKMLAYFEKVAKETYEKTLKNSEINKQIKQVEDRIADNSIDDQRIYSYLKERAKADPDRNNAVAIIDCTRQYTYSEMFDEWDKYAKVFSGLKITSKNKSRVAIAGTISAEPLFAFYGLNMVGVTVSMFSYPDFLKGGRWKAMVEKEKITDLVISDLLLTPGTFKEILAEKEKLGIRNIILTHSLLGGPTVGPAELTFNEFNYHAIKRMSEAIYINDLFDKYKDTKIAYAKQTGEDIALITHTSGSTKGTRKPLPYTNRSVNHVSTALPNGFCFILENKQRLRIAPSFDFSSFVNIGGNVNMSLATGYAVVLTAFGFMNPKFIKAVKYYQLNVMVAGSFMVDNWMKMDYDDIDFSSMLLMSMGGSFISLEKKKKYKEFFESKGLKSQIVYGYGMSEAGGASLAVREDTPDDVLGYPINKNDFRIKDEKTGKFYKISNKERTGIMYARSDSMSSNMLDGEVLFELTKIDGLDFVCTNDLVHQNKDGSLSYVGRADKFFVNNEGVRFEAGLLETVISQNGIVDKCAIVPVLDKRIHDTVPVLYLVLNDQDDITNKIKNLLLDVYQNNEKLKGTVIPSQVMVVKDIPLGTSGKIDTYKITRTRLEGSAYNLTPVLKNKELIDLKIEYAESLSSIKAGDLPEGMGQDSAFNVFDMMQGGVKLPKFKLPELPKLEMPEIDLSKLTKNIDMDKMMANSKKYMKYGNRLVGLLYKQEIHDEDFED